MTGLYVPFWLCDVDAFSVRGQGSKIGLTDDTPMTNAFVSIIEYHTTRICRERIPVEVRRSYDKVLVELNHFLRHLVSFDMQYLSGFLQIVLIEVLTIVSLKYTNELRRNGKGIL